MKESIYIFAHGELKRKENTLCFTNKEGIRKYLPVEQIKEIHCFGEINLNKELLEFLSQHQIILHFYNHYEYYVGSYYPREYYNSGYLTLKQAEYYLNIEARLLIARQFISGAQDNMTKTLQYYCRRGINLSSYLETISTLSQSIDKQKTVEELMALEGNIREVYYQALDTIFASSGLVIDKRTRRPPTMN